jgi:hypothetical protein
MPGRRRTRHASTRDSEQEPEARVGRLAGMLRNRTLALLAVVSIAACGGAAAPSATPGAAPTERPTPTPVPGASDLPGSGGGSQPGFPDPNTCCDGGLIGNFFPDNPNGNPLFGDATYLKPAMGLLDPRAMNVQLVRAAIGPADTVLVDLRWWSGVAPCNQLDRVEIVIDEAANTVRLSVFEGSGPGDIACIEIAELHATLVDIGKVASGAWAISAEGDAPAITLDVH